MTDSGGRSISLSRDKTIPAAPQATHVEKKYAGWNVLWPVLRRQTFKHSVRFLFCTTVHPCCIHAYPRRTYWGESAFCVSCRNSETDNNAALQRGPPSSSLCVSHWILDDELINFPTIDLDWMMSFSANHCAAALSHAQTQLAMGPSQCESCSHMTFTPVTSGLCIYCSSCFNLLPAAAVEQPWPT